MQDATFRNKRQDFQKLKSRKVNGNETSGSPTEILGQQASILGEKTVKKPFERDIPPIRLQLTKKTNPKWLDQRILRETQSLDSVIEFIMSCFGDVELSDNPELWYTEISDLNHQLSDAGLTKNQSGTYLRCDEIYVSNFLDYREEDFEFGSNTLNKTLLFTFMDLIEFLSCGVNVMEELVGFHEDQIEEGQDNTDEYDLEYSKNILEKLAELEINGGALLLEYRTNWEGILNDPDFLIELLYYDGYVQSAKWLHKNRNTIPYLYSLIEESANFEVYHNFPIGIYPKMDDDLMQEAQNFYNDYEPYFSIQKDLEDKEEIRLPVLHLMVYNFINSFWSILCQEYKKKMGIKN